MKWIAVLPLLASVSCSAVSDQARGNLTGAAYPNRATFYLGGRKLDEGDWNPVEEQGVFGAEFARCEKTVGWEVGVLGSADETKIGGVNSEGRTSELYGGLRFEFGDSLVRPYIGVGATAISMKLDVDSVGDDDDGTLGAYVHGGITIDVTPRVYIGLDARGVVGSEVRVLGVDRDVDYRQLALALGFAF